MQAALGVGDELRPTWERRHPEWRPGPCSSRFGWKDGYRARGARVRKREVARPKCLEVGECGGGDLDDPAEESDAGRAFDGAPRAAGGAGLMMVPCNGLAGNERG